MKIQNVFFSQKMATGFSKVEVPDPNKIVDFIEFSTDAMAGIFEVGIF